MSDKVRQRLGVRGRVRALSCPDTSVGGRKSGDMSPQSKVTAPQIRVIYG
jgi:hypothetical protein